MNNKKAKVISEMNIPGHKRIALYESLVKPDLFVVTTICTIKYEVDSEEGFQDDLDAAIMKYIELTTPTNGS